MCGKNWVAISATGASEMKNPVFEQVCENLIKNPRRWLVTGVAGFIGSHLLEKLLELGQSVIGLDNFSQGHRSNIEEVFLMEKSKRGSFHMMEADLCDEQACIRACEGVDVVLHQGALGSVPRSIAQPLMTHASNVDGFINMLDAAKNSGIKRFVYASSSSVYGDAPELPKVEDKTGKPLSPYALSKWMNEEYAELYCRLYGMECLGLRYFNVFGPRQDPEGAYAAVMPRWFSALKKGERPVIYGDGETSRDFCFVDNVVQVNLLAATTTCLEAYGHAYNVACEERTTLNELFMAIRDLACPGSDLRPLYEDFRPGDIRHSLASTEKAQRLLGYRPTMDIRAGLKVAAPWYLK